MSNTIVITKMSNSNVFIINGDREYLLSADYLPRKDVANSLVEIYDTNGGLKDTFSVEDVEKLVRDGMDIPVTDINDFFTELITHFFLNTEEGEFSTIDSGNGLISGVITGFDVTINIDPTKFDVSAGVGIIIDWSNPSAPITTRINYAGVTAVSITDGIGTGIFTSLYIDNLGILQQVTGVQLTPNQRRQNIVINTVVHTDLTEIDNVSVNAIQAYQAIEALYDYVLMLGPVNLGNDYSANAINLTVQKSSGLTTLPWINRNINPQNPTNESNLSQSPLISSSTSIQYRDGGGGFVFVPNFMAVSPNLWDNGSGVLATVSNNKWTIQRFYFFGQTNGTLVTYGQSEYSTLAEAELNIHSESPILFGGVSLGHFSEALIVKKGATNLSDITQAKFVKI